MIEFALAPPTMLTLGKWRARATVVALALLAAVLLAVGFSSSAEAQDDLDLSVNTVSPSWLLLPEGLKPYDRFRVVFISSGSRNAMDRNQETYHEWIRTQATNAGLPAANRYNAYVCGARPIGGSSSHLAINLGMAVRNNNETGSDAGSLHNPFTMNTYAAGAISAVSEAPVYWVNGRKAYDNAVDLLNSYGPRTMMGQTSSHTDEWGRNNTSDNVWTGCLSGKVGSLETDLGSAEASARSPVDGRTNKRDATNGYSVYGVSPVYTVGPYEKQMEVQHTLTGSPTGPLMFDSNAEGSYTVGIKSAAGQPMADVTVTASVVDGSAKFKTKDNVRLSTTAGTTYADAHETVTVTIARASWETAQTIYVVPKPGARPYSGLFFIDHTMDGGVTDLNWHRFGGKYFRVRGRVKTFTVKTTEVPNIVFAVQGSLTGMEPNATTTFTVKLSGPPTGPKATVYVSPVDDLSRVQARCKVAHPDWTCRRIGQPIVNSNGDPVYVWSFSESPLTLKVGNADCDTSSQNLQERLVSEHKCSKPKSKPHIALTFNKANWNTTQRVTVKRTGNSFRSHTTERTGKLYISFVYPGQLHTDFKTDNKTKTIDVTLNNSRVLNSPPQEIEFHGVEEHGGVPQQMSDAELQQLQQGQQEPELSITGGASVTEGQDAVFTITASPVPAADLTVSVDIAQSGDFGVSTGSRTVAVPASGSATLTIATVDDDDDEPDGSVTATLVVGTGYTISGTRAAATVAVSDDDDAPVVQSDTEALETGIQERIDRTAQNGDNHSNRIWRGALAAVRGEEPTGDAREVDAAFAQRLSDNHGSKGRAELSALWQEIADALNGVLPPPPPPTPELTISGGAGVTEGQDAVFTISAGPAAASPLTVNLSVSQAGDFASSLPSSITLTGGAATLRISTTDDGTDEADGSITVALSSGSGYTVSGSQSSASVAVSDNDDPPPPPPPPPPETAGSLDCDNSDVIVDEVTIAEDRYGTSWLEFNLTLCEINYGQVHIDYHMEHITTDDSDVYLWSGTLIIEPFAQKARAIRTMVYSDGKTEGDETVALVFTGVDTPGNPINLGHGRVKATITDPK